MEKQTKGKVGRPKKEQKKKYGFVQLELDAYNDLTEYCGLNGLKIGLFASRTIQQKIAQLKLTTK